jgi:hypothetical protein
VARESGSRRGGIDTASTVGNGATSVLKRISRDVRAWDIAIRPDGKGLPPGRGTAAEGAQLYVQKGCAGRHTLARHFSVVPV